MTALRVEVVRLGKGFGTVDVHESDGDTLGPVIADLMFTTKAVDDPERHETMTMELGTTFSQHGANVLWTKTADVIGLAYQALRVQYQPAMEEGLRIRVAMPLVEDAEWMARVAPVCRKINRPGAR